MIMRAWQLRLLNDYQRKNLLINLGRRRWKTREPLDDVLEPEKPRFLKKCFELLIGKGVLPAIEASLMLGIQSADIEEMASLDNGYLGNADAPVSLTTDQEPAAEDAGMIVRFPYQNRAESKPRAF